ncbi:MAG: hypothetical protein M1434_08125 [Chloroflexi bacterium]|nr:hypothetical protein [Chloroflexota bacterium]MCL5274697.1 hypothetical protein [Chloroflexota bacterium]
MEPFEAQALRVFETGQPYKGELVFPLPNGLAYDEFIISPVMGADGRVDAAAAERGGAIE